MLVFVLLVWCYLVRAAPFVTTWNTSQANQQIQLPTIYLESNVTIDWGDSTIPTTFFANSSANVSHIYASAGLYNVSMEGQFRWSRFGNPTNLNLVDIVSWGDGFLVDQTSDELFYYYRNLQVSAPPNTQPMFLSGATLSGMFGATSFNSSLDWDLTNATDLSDMFADASFLNKPINFRNTQGVTTTASLFYQASQFNQPFHFDASGLLDANRMFAMATAFNQAVNLINSSKLTDASQMFGGASSFNQPITFNVDSVTTMSNMFSYATSFNQPINFPSTSKLTTTAQMFENATSFNQPVTLNTSYVDTMSSMFAAASSFASPINFTSTTRVTNMDMMFDSAFDFDQDLSSWDVSQVIACALFCPWCGLPSFPSCVPCAETFTNGQGMSVCTNGTRAPTTSAPSTTTPSTAPSTTTAPSAALSVVPSIAPSTAAPSAAAAVPASSPGADLVQPTVIIVIMVAVVVIVCC